MTDINNSHDGGVFDIVASQAAEVDEAAADAMDADQMNDGGADEAPAPIVWEALSSENAEFEWLTLNEWVEDVRRVYAIPDQVIPPFWHRHKILVEHISALRLHWLAAFHPTQHASGPFGWLRDLDEWKTRMRETVAELGCRPDTCRPEPHIAWPGEPDIDPTEWPPPVNIDDRYDDFVTFVMWDVDRRHNIEEHYLHLAGQGADAGQS